MIFALLLAAVVITGCGDAHSHSHKADEHDVKLQLTAYGNDFEVYAEATPFVVGEKSDILAHFTLLNNFKPLTGGSVTASLIVGGKKVIETVKTPAHPGIYKFNLTPETAGRGQIVFDIQSDSVKSQIIVKDVNVYTKREDAQHAAADAVVESSNAVVFTKEMSWKVDFSTEPCRKEPFGQVIRTMAQVEPTQGDERVIIAKAGGIVTFHSNDITDGKAVNVNQPIVYINSGDMADDNLIVRYKEAESNYNLAQKEYERKKTLAADKIVAESEMLKAKADYEAAAAIYSNLRKNFASGGQAVTSPISGFIKRLLVSNGQYVEAGQTIASVAQNRNLFIRAEIPSRYYSLLGNIETANIRLLNDKSVYSLSDVGGTMVSYGKSVDANNPLLPVVFKVNNTIDLLPGSFVEMYIKTRNTQPAITVASISIVEEMGNYFVYVQLTPEFFEKREVRIGQTDGKRTEIVSGLKEGERVVGKGAILVKLAQASGTLDAHSGHVH